MRSFQFSDAKSHKFWTVAVSGTDVTTTYGKVGSAGQSSTKSFATPAKAQAEADKLVREKTGKGYVETTAGAAVSDAEALERGVRANPHDAAAWAALADYLAERGDPRGEFMAVQLALESEGRSREERLALRDREEALLTAHAREWLGPLAAFTVDAKPTKPTRHRGVDEAPVKHRFDRGWLGRVEFPNLTVAQARALAACPSARLLRELAVGGVEAEVPVGQTARYVDSHYEPGPDVPADLEPYGDPGLHALCRFPHLWTVRVFQLGNGIPGGDDTDHCHTSGDLAIHLVKQMPSLEGLYLFAHQVDAAKIFSLPMPELRALQLYHIVRYPLERLAANKSLANLTTLLCHPHALEPDDEEHPQDGVHAHIRLEHLRAICRSPNLPKLAVLRLRLTDFGDAGAEEIVKSGILKRLTVLDLQGGCMGDDGAKLLANCPDLKNLRSLNLSRNALAEDGIEALRRTGVPLDVTSQHTSRPPFDEDDFDAIEYLYEGDYE